MVKRIFGNAIWQLVMQADIVSKIVLLILLAFSIVCWAIFLYKLILFRIKKNQMAKVMSEIKKAGSLDDLLVLVAKYKDTLPGYFISKNLSFLKKMIVIDPEMDRAEITPRQWELFQQHIDQTIEDIVYHEQSYLSVLSTSASVAPLLGLFGTVWGLIHSFVRISQKQSADIATVAPGIAEALITTLAGLAVAVPALLMFNFCASRVRNIDQRLTLLADKLILKVQRFVLK